jgi:hypothetical protein
MRKRDADAMVGWSRGRERARLRRALVLHDWPDSEMHDSLAFGELRIGAKTKAGPLEAEQLSRLGNIALVR